MPTIHFLGQIFPRRGITLNESPQMELRSPSLRTIVTIQITDSQIDVTCELDHYDRQDVDILHLHVFQLVRTWVDAIAFSRGMGLTTVIEFFVDPSGERAIMQAHDPLLENLCLIPIPVPSHVMEFDVAAILHMLTSSLEEPRLIAVNCARAVEAIAHQISPGERKKTKRWKRLQETLQVTWQYTRQITDISRGPRHGELVEPLNADQLEARRKAWILMGRFLEFRRRGRNALPIAEFPLLQ